MVGQSGCPTTARAVGWGYAVRIPQEVRYEDTHNPHNSSGGGDTALLKIWGFRPVSPTIIIAQILPYPIVLFLLVEKF